MLVADAEQHWVQREHAEVEALLRNADELGIGRRGELAVDLVDGAALWIRSGDDELLRRRLEVMELERRERQRRLEQSDDGSSRNELPIDVDVRPLEREAVARRAAHECDVTECVRERGRQALFHHREAVGEEQRKCLRPLRVLRAVGGDPLTEGDGLRLALADRADQVSRHAQLLAREAGANQSVELEPSRADLP